MEPPCLSELTYRAQTGDDGQRLDRVLAGHEGMSRTRFQALIDAGRVTVNGQTIMERKHLVKSGDIIHARVPPARPATPAAEPVALNIVHEDDDLVVIDKPAGMTVHPGAGKPQGTLVNALLHHCAGALSGIGGIARPGIVHRLDKLTSGLMVAAKTDAAHQGLSAQFAAHGRDGRLKRAYRALVWGEPPHASGVVDGAIARARTDRRKMTVDAAGRPARTHYRVLARYANGGKTVASQIECVLETGRTHQIRVHFAHIGRPLLGDPVYGAGFKASAATLGEPAQIALAALGRQALHAAMLGFRHPVGGQALEFHSPLPADMADLEVALAGEREDTL